MTCRTTITVSSNTKQKLAAIGKFGQSYDDLIQQLIQKQIEEK